MSSEASSTTNSRKRKLVASEADEVFVLKKKKERTVTKTVSLCIPDLLENINDENYKTEFFTPIFKLGNLDFRFKIIPEEQSGFIGFFIFNENHEEVKISLKFEEEPGGYSWSNWYKQPVEAMAVHGWPDYFSHDDYRELAAENGDEFKITASVTLHLTEGSNGGVKWENLRSKSVPDPTGAIEKMCIEDGVFSDWTIISEEGQRFPCHRNILAAKSSTMKAMMTTEMKEKEEMETRLKYNNKVVGAFVDYFYKGEVPRVVLETNLSSFMELSDFYNLDPLKSQVEDVAIKSLDLENVVEMFSLANIHNAESLKRVSRYFIIENRKILGQQDLSQVPPSVMAELFKLLSQS